MEIEFPRSRIIRAKWGCNPDHPIHEGTRKETAFHLRRSRMDQRSGLDPMLGGSTFALPHPKMRDILLKRFMPMLPTDDTS
mmetsp:Transcript_120420/g.225097  ORF Transcript_120420/g.225097 Transcript_120420/m.225097 type:complete len:81 (+) Transcript_120420:302-544(+)